MVSPDKMSDKYSNSSLIKTLSVPFSHIIAELSFILFLKGLLQEGHSYILS